MSSPWLGSKNFGFGCLLLNPNATGSDFQQQATKSFFFAQGGSCFGYQYEHITYSSTSTIYLRNRYRYGYISKHIHKIIGQKVGANFKDTAGEIMLVVFQRCLPFFLYFVLEKKLQNIQRENVQKRSKTHISPTEKVVNEHEKMLARVPQGCTTAVHTCEKHCRLLGYTPEHVNNNFSWPPPRPR